MKFRRFIELMNPFSLSSRLTSSDSIPVLFMALLALLLVVSQITEKPVDMTYAFFCWFSGFLDDFFRQFTGWSAGSICTGKEGLVKGASFFVWAVGFLLCVITANGLRKNGLPRNSFVNLLTVVLIAVFIARVFGLYLTTSHSDGYGDEYFWIHGAYFYNLFFVKNDFFNEDWHNFISYEAPPVSRYVIGFALDRINHRIVETGGGLTLFQKACFDVMCGNLRDSAMGYPGDARLMGYCDSVLLQLKEPVVQRLDKVDYDVARRVMLLFGVSTSLLLTLLCSHYLNRVFSGLLAATVFLSNGITIPTFQLVLLDAMCCFFILLSLISLIELSGKLRRYCTTNSSSSLGGKRLWEVAVLSIVTGFLLSLAVGTKFISAYLVVTVVVVFIVKMFFEHGMVGPGHGEHNRLLRMASLMGVFVLVFTSAFAFFVLMNPFIYPSPIGNTLKLFNNRLDSMALQERVVGEVSMPHMILFGELETKQIIKDVRIRSLSHRLRLLYSKGLLLNHRFQVPFYELIYVFLILAGLSHIIRESCGELSEGFFGNHSVVTAFIILTFLVNGTFMNSDWDRYYTYFAVCTCMMLAFGVEVVLRSADVYLHKIVISMWEE
ncbi:MAG: phospholipid carrier-dependent glycosyltransferase [Candidatus Altiarchaeota archaeon]